MRWAESLDQCCSAPVPVAYSGILLHFSIANQEGVPVQGAAGRRPRRNFRAHMVVLD